MANLFDLARKRLGYALSLPERTVRSLAAVASGTVSLLTETVLPPALRETTIYTITLGLTQQFVIDRIAQVQRESPSARVADDEYVKRKMVGGALEAAALFAVHFSPLWIFAIASDAAAGSRVFLDRLSEQLKRNDVVAEDTQIDELVDLLAALQHASHKSAIAVDLPPLSRADLAQLATDLTTTYGETFAKATGLLPRLEDIWDRMAQLASREHISLEALQGLMTVDAARWAKMGLGSVRAVGQTGTALFGEKVLASYVNTLDGIAEHGADQYLRRHMQPFLRAAADHFHPEKRTWTEMLLRRRDG